MPSETKALLVALQKRANTEESRYSGIKVPPDVRQTTTIRKPGLLTTLADESEVFVKENCKFLQAPGAG